MSTGEYSAMGRLGQRIALDPPVPAIVVRLFASTEERPRGLRRRARSTDDAAAAATVEIELVDYSVTGISFTTAAGHSLEADEECALQLGSSISRLRIVDSRTTDDDVVWGATFLDPWPEVLRAIEESALHKDVEVEQARWNAQRD
jgi:hypothetical protein